MSDTIRNPPRPGALWELLRIQTECIQELEQALASQQKPAPVLLTDDEIAALWKAWPHQAITSAQKATLFARAIESAVHRKNGWGV